MTTQIIPTILSQQSFTHIIHISDIHIRPNERHDEFRHVFHKLYDELTIIKATNIHAIIVLTGDIFDNKNRFLPEQYDLCNELFTTLSSIFPLIVILGNHDMKDNTRLDSITPSAYTRPNFYYLPKSGAYEFNNVVFSISSLYDTDQPFIKREHIKTNKTCIALYHGTLSGATNDDNYTFTQTHNSTLKSKSDFINYDACLLGDIHKAQAITPLIQYSGSLIQQNYGESLRKHGFLLWDITNPTNITTSFHDIRSDYGMITIHITDNQITNYPQDIPKYTSLRAYIKNTTQSQIDDIINIIKTKTTLLDYRQIDNNINTVTTIENYTPDNTQDLILKELKTQPNPESIIKIHTEYMQQIKSNVINNTGHYWYPITLKFKNLFGYADNHENTINFKNGVSSITGQNATGKTSIMNVILFGLFHKLLYKGTQNMDILNNKESKGYLKLVIQHGTSQYTIHKNFTRQINKLNPVSVITKLEYINNGTDITLSSDVALSKLKELVGDIDDFHKCNILNNKDQYNDFFALTNGDKIKYLKDIFQLNYFDDLMALNKTKLLSIDTMLSNKKAHQTIMLNEVKTLSLSNTITLDSIQDELIKLNQREIFIQKKTQQLTKEYETIQREISKKELHIIKIDNTYEELEKNVTELNKKHSNFTQIYNINELNTELGIKKSQLITSPYTLQDLQNKLTLITNKLTTINIPITYKSKDEVYKIKCQYEAKITTLEKDIAQLKSAINFEETITKIIPKKSENEIINEINTIQKQYKPQPSTQLLTLKQKIKTTKIKISKHKNTTIHNLNDLIKQITIIEKDIEQLKITQTTLKDNLKTLNKSFELDIDIANIPQKIQELQTNIKNTIQEQNKTPVNIILHKKDSNELDNLNDKINNLQQKTLTGENVEEYIKIIDATIQKNKLSIKEFSELKTKLLSPIQTTLQDIKNNKIDDYKNELNTLMNAKTILVNKINANNNIINENKKIDKIVIDNKNIIMNNKIITRQIKTYNYYLTHNTIQNNNDTITNLTTKLFDTLNLYEYNKLKIELETFQNELSCIEHNEKSDKKIKELKNMINSIKMTEYTNKLDKATKLKSKLNDINKQYEHFCLNIEKNDITNRLKTIETNTTLTNEISNLESKIIYEIDRTKKIKFEQDMITLTDNDDYETDIQELNYKMKIVLNEKNNLQKEQNTITEKKTDFNYKYNKLKHNFGELHKLKLDIENLESTKQTLTDYNKLIGPKNLQVIIIKNELMKLEETMNNVLSRYTKYKASIKCDDGQNIKILIKNDNEPLKINLMSAYENLILLTSFKIAIGKHTNKSKSKLYIMDESLENMDQDNLMKSLPGLLNLILSEYSYILMVSQRDVKHVECEEIKVIKNNGVSKVYSV